VLCQLAFGFELLFLLICRLFKTTDLLVLERNHIHHLIEFNSLPKQVNELNLVALLVACFLPLLQVLQVTAEKPRDKVIFNVVQRFLEPAARAQIKVV